MADPAPVAGMFWLDEELGMAVLVNLQYDHGEFLVLYDAKMLLNFLWKLQVVTREELMFILTEL